MKPRIIDYLILSHVDHPNQAVGSGCFVLEVFPIVYHVLRLSPGGQYQGEARGRGLGGDGGSAQGCVWGGGGGGGG